MHRPDCLPVAERVDEEGGVLEPIDLTGLGDRVAERLAGERRRAASRSPSACSSPTSTPSTSARRATLLRERFPDLPVSLSHEIAPIWREYERGTTTAVDAYTKPLFERYVDGVSTALDAQGVAGRWALLKSNGGHALAHEARERPAHLLLSGIAGGVIGGAHMARAAGGEQAVRAGHGRDELRRLPDRRRRAALLVRLRDRVRPAGQRAERLDAHDRRRRRLDRLGRPGRLPAGRPAERGRRSRARRLRPRRQRRRPSPTPTSCSAASIRGSSWAAGCSSSRSSHARRSPQLGERLGFDETRAASAIIRIANENMANAIRIVTVEEGIDPRGFALVAFGGAGPTHACEIADAIGMSRVVVPPRPGLCSAFGALAASVRVDAVRSVYLTDRRTSAGRARRPLRRARGRGARRCRRAGRRAPTPDVRRAIAMRYQGQNYEQEVIVPPGAIDDAALTAIYADYGRLYEEFYGYRLDGIPIELVRLSVVATEQPPAFASLPSESGVRATPSRDARRSTSRATASRRRRVVRRETLAPGERADGPLIVESMDSTVVVPPEWSLRRLGESGILDVTRR